jgi:hypothetical protein
MKTWLRVQSYSSGEGPLRRIPCLVVTGIHIVTRRHINVFLLCHSTCTAAADEGSHYESSQFTLRKHEETFICLLLGAARRAPPPPPPGLPPPPPRRRAAARTARHRGLHNALPTPTPPRATKRAFVSVHIRHQRQVILPLRLECDGSP